MKQPKTLTVNGSRYRLVTPYRMIDADIGKSVGPHYAKVPAVAGMVFMPDSPYLLGLVSRPSTMHPIRLGESPRTRSSRRRRT